MRHRYFTPLLLIVVCVTFAHWVALDWAGGYAPVAVEAMPEPIFARLLEQRHTPPRQATPAAVRSAKQYAALSADTTPPPRTLEPAVDISPTVIPNEEPTPAPEALVPIPADASVPEPPTNEGTWPPDTRVSYALKGYFRGDFYGDAKVQWQRQGMRYQAQVDIRLPLFIQLTLTSVGQVTDKGLAPETYQEVRPGRRDQMTVVGADVRLNGGQLIPKPEGMQDTASQFVALSQRFATKPDLLKVGGEVSLWLGRPNGVDLWTYDIVAEETLMTPKLGAVQAFHLKPRPLAQPRGPIMAELWFAPSLQYLPVRVLITQGDDTFVDLLVEKIEQSAPVAQPSP